MRLEETLLRALLELYQDMPSQIATKDLNDLVSYRRLEEVRRCLNKVEESLSLKEFATLKNWRSFRYVSCVSGMAYNPLVNEETRDSYLTLNKQ